ncbi:MAG: pentapeptide repeat-containing protein, partial [Planctomycetota bacterium]
MRLRDRERGGAPYRTTTRKPIKPEAFAPRCRGAPLRRVPGSSFASSSRSSLSEWLPISWRSPARLGPAPPPAPPLALNEARRPPPASRRARRSRARLSRARLNRARLNRVRFNRARFNRARFNRARFNRARRSRARRSRARHSRARHSRARHSRA